MPRQHDRRVSATTVKGLRAGTDLGAPDKSAWRQAKSQTAQRLRHDRPVTSRGVIVQRYLRYLETCNRHAWDELSPFLTGQVLVNGQQKTRQQYVEDLRALEASFPDYRWRLLRAVVEGDWLAVHLHDSGTRAGPFLTAPGDASRVTTDEFAMYRLIDGRICEVEVTADNARLAIMNDPGE